MARILVIEDNPENLELMRYLLQAFGHEPHVATDGQAGLDRALQLAPDLIVVDLNMPRLNGLEVARRLKSDLAARHVPLVAVTAYAMVGDRDRVLAGGFDGYLSKPIDPERFVSQIEAFLAAGAAAGPARAAPAPAAPAAAPAPAAPAPTAAPGPRSAAAPGAPAATVLMIDDTPRNLDVVRATLEPRGYVVRAARSLGEAVALARQLRPDLILCDVHMPGSSGFETLRAVKADPSLRRVPFVFLSSADPPDADRAHGLTIGADDFLVRPITAEALLAAVEGWVRAPGPARELDNGHDPGS